MCLFDAQPYFDGFDHLVEKPPITFSCPGDGIATHDVVHNATATAYFLNRISDIIGVAGLADNVALVSVYWMGASFYCSNGRCSFDDIASYNKVRCFLFMSICCHSLDRRYRYVFTARIMLFLPSCRKFNKRWNQAARSHTLPTLTARYGMLAGRRFVLHLHYACGCIGCKRCAPLNFHIEFFISVCFPRTGLSTWCFYNGFLVFLTQCTHSCIVLLSTSSAYLQEVTPFPFVCH